MTKFRLILILLVIYAMLLSIFHISSKQADYKFDFSDKKANISSVIEAEELADLSYNQYNHASSITSMGNKLFITWYSGDKETAPNTDIVLTIAYKKNDKWQFTKPKAIMTLDKYQRSTQKAIHHLGNPSIFANNGKLWLFFTTSSGGWSTSSINIIHSDDLGKTWSEPTPILSTATANHSSLTRGNAVALKDGMFALPMYNEFKATNCRWLIFDKNGKLIDASEMTHNNTSLQPVVATITDNKAISFYRTLKTSKHNKIYTNITNDGGKTWQSSHYTKLDNPDADIAILTAKNGVFLAYNNSTENRRSITIAYRSYNDSSWKNIYEFKDNDNLIAESSYPDLTSVGDKIYLTYSFRKTNSAIKSIKIIEISGVSND